jgi:8-oxo-dGTP pyrophosphatase MutT (NUDIX family)
MARRGLPCRAAELPLHDDPPLPRFPFDPMGLPVVEQAGAVVYRKDDKGVRILLVRARRNPEDWIFPKGHVERGESAEEAAVREAEEEAGVTGRVVSALDPPVSFTQDDRRLEVRYFLVEFQGEVKPKERREQAWLPPRDALKRLTHESARSLLARALVRLDAK